MKLLTSDEVDALWERVVAAERRERYAAAHHKEEMAALVEKMDALVVERDDFATGKKGAKCVSAYLQAYDMECKMLSSYETDETRYLPAGREVTMRVFLPQNAHLLLADSIIVNMTLEEGLK